jgi:predicted lipoprotein
MRRWKWPIVILLFATLCWRFPLFQVVPLAKAIQDKAAATFNPAQFAETFWQTQLLKSLDKAVPTEALLPAMQADPSAARKKYSRSVGLDDSYDYFVTGQGRVVAISDDEISLAMSAGTNAPEISLEVGLLFGNAVRDGTGLLNVNNYPNSQDFNAISEALNHIVETQVLDSFRAKVKTGQKIRFTGCAEVDDESTDLHPLKVVPVQAEIQ